MHVSGKTRVYAVLGHPVSHSLSPAMHNAHFAAQGDDAVYVAFDVAQERVLDAVHSLHALGCGGLSVTIPHKEVLFRGLPRLDASARQAGAVNTVQFTPEGPVGHTTDGVGWLRAFEEAFGSIAGKRVLILGYGGSARAVARAALDQGGVSDLALVWARNEDKARQLALALSSNERAVRTLHWMDRAPLEQAEVIIQTTPIGMKQDDPDAASFTALPFRPGQLAMDLIYTAPETPFMKAARASGARTVNGLGMLLHQGARQYEIWTGKSADLAVLRAALEKAVS